MVDCDFIRGQMVDDISLKLQWSPYCKGKLDENDPLTRVGH